MTKITLNPLVNLENEVTAVAQINVNNNIIAAAMDNTLSRDGTSPNTMLSQLDMNSNRVINLPQPLFASEPLRLQDLVDFVGGTISNIPSGGNSGDVFVKLSNTDYDFGWAPDSSLITAGNNIVTSGTSPVTIGTTLTPTFTTVNGVTLTATTGTMTIANLKTLTVNNTVSFNATDGAIVNFAAGGTVGYTGTGLGQFASTTSAQLAGVLSDETGTGSVVFSNSPTLVTPALGTPSSVTLTNATGLPVSTGVSGLGTGVATFLGTPSSANLYAALTTKTGSGNAVFGTSPTLTTPVISSIVNTGTLTLPTATDTLVGRATTDTLTNKTISGASNTLSNIPLGSLNTQPAFTLVGNNTSGAAVPTAVDIAGLTTKASPAATDYVMISDQAASGAWKKVTIATLASAGSVGSYNGRTGSVVGVFNDVPIRGYIAGLTLSTAGSSSTYSIAVGVATDTTMASMMSLGSAYSKTTASWAVGSATGSLDTGTIANSTWYHVHLIQRPDTGVVDVLLSLSATSPTMPTNYTLRRRIGAMLTNGSAQWVLFIQTGDQFWWASPPLDFSSTAPGNGSATLHTLSVPTGVSVIPFTEGYITGSGGSQVYFSSPSQTDIITPNGSSGIVPSTSGFGGIRISVPTNTSAQIRARANAAITINASTMGWTDRRGKDA